MDEPAFLKDYAKVPKGEHQRQISSTRLSAVEEESFVQEKKEPEEPEAPEVEVPPGDVLLITAIGDISYKPAEIRDEELFVLLIFSNRADLFFIPKVKSQFKIAFVNGSKQVLYDCLYAGVHFEIDEKAYIIFHKG